MKRNSIIELKEMKNDVILLYKLYLAQAGQSFDYLNDYHENEHDNSGGDPDYHNNSHDNTPGKQVLKRMIRNVSN